MGTSRTIALAFIALGACRSSASGPVEPARPAQFRFELALLYERYGDLEHADHELVEARAQTKDYSLVLAIESARGRIEEARHDLPAAAIALALAQDAYDRITVAQHGAPPMQSALLDVDPHELTLRRARLASALGDVRRADELYLRALGGVTEPFERDRVLLARVTAYQQAKTLDAHVAAWEQTGDEAALRSLAVAYGDGLAGNLGTSVDPAKRTRVLERLAALHPEDLRVRDALLAGYERQHDTEHALALLHAAAPTPAETCAEGLPPLPLPTEVDAVAQAVQSLARMQKPAEAVVEIDRLAALAKQPELHVAALCVAARLYWSLGKAELADKAVATAAAAAHSLDEKRAVASTRAFGLEHEHRTAALSQLYDEWTRGDDACLRTEGTHGLARFQQIAQRSTP